VRSAHVERGSDGPIELNVQSGRRTVLFVTVDRAADFDFSVTVNGGSGTFHWAGGSAPSLAAGEQNAFVFQEIADNEVVGSTLDTNA
jgi:hypothetical protein